MTPQDFIAKWGAPSGVPGPAYALNEEQGAQSHFLKRPVAVMAVPLAPLDNPQHATVLNPKLEVAGQAFVLETLAIGSFEPGELRSPLTNLGQDAQAIWDALDYAMHGC